MSQEKNRAGWSGLVEMVLNFMDTWCSRTVLVTVTDIPDISWCTHFLLSLGFLFCLLPIENDDFLMLSPPFYCWCPAYAYTIVMAAGFPSCWPSGSCIVNLLEMPLGLSSSQKLWFLIDNILQILWSDDLQLPLNMVPNRTLNFFRCSTRRLLIGPHSLVLPISTSEISTDSHTICCRDPSPCFSSVQASSSWDAFRQSLVWIRV